MNAEQRELFRQALLRVLDANDTRFGLGERALALLVNQFGFSPSLDETRREMEYLAEKTFAANPKKDISPENRAWKITAVGRDYLAEHGG